MTKRRSRATDKAIENLDPHARIEELEHEISVLRRQLEREAQARVERELGHAIQQARQRSDRERRFPWRRA